MKLQRQRAEPNDIAYGLYLYFMGISYRNAARALCEIVNRIIYPPRNGYKNIDQLKYQLKEKRLTYTLLMKP